MRRWISSINSKVGDFLGGRLGRVIGIATLAALLMLGMTVTTVFAQSAQEIKGCYVKSGKNKGHFRILTGTSTTCKNTEVLVHWNQVGPQGPQGQQGLPGEKGEKGDPGAPGLQGEKGDKGDPGLPGEKGDKGDPCQATDPACRGPQGDPGAPGLQGEKGDKGDHGDQGDPGLPGEKGDQGDSGLPGEKGDKGDPGTDGNNGADGSNGKTVLHGTTAPDSSDGSDGDFYINTATQEIYGPKSGDDWGEPTSLKGDKGDNGVAGEKGEKGDTGATGPAGPATNVTLRMGSVVSSINPNSNGTSNATCAAGEKTSGGGYIVGKKEVVVWQNGPTPSSEGSTPTGWTVQGTNTATGQGATSNSSLMAYVLCAS